MNLYRLKELGGISYCFLDGSKSELIEDLEFDEFFERIWKRIPDSVKKEDDT